MDYQSYNRTTLNTRRIRRVDDKIMVIPVPSKVKNDIIKTELRLPYKGVIKDIYASCGAVGGDDTSLTIERCSQADFDVIPVWETILADPITIKSNRRSSKTSNLPYSFAPGGDKVNPNDHFRVTYTKEGGAGGIVVEIVVEIQTEEE